jgi:hypothetical protein
MSNRLEGKAREILDGPNLAVVSVPRRDGSVQSVVACVGVNGQNLELNSQVGRAWAVHLERGRRATVLALDGGNPLAWVSVEAELIDATTEDAAAHMDALARKYGMERRPQRPNEQRIRFTLRPTRVVHLEQTASGSRSVNGQVVDAGVSA